MLDIVLADPTLYVTAQMQRDVDVALLVVPPRRHAGVCSLWSVCGGGCASRVSITV
jgi:hypothetical protein